MAKYLIIDYTTDEENNFFIYELQRFIGSNNHKFYDHDSLNYTVIKFYTSLSERYENTDNPQHLLHSELLTGELNGEKTLQRILLQQNIKTQKYNPDFLIIDRKSNNLSNSEKEKIKLFYEKHKAHIVIKATGSLGYGNYFSRNKLFDETLKIIEKQLSFGRSLSLEAEVMLTNEKINKKYAQDNKTPGIYKRSMLIANNTALEHVTVYKNILDTEKTTDNHSNNRYDFKNKGYLTSDIEDALNYSKKKYQKNPISYNEQVIFFQNLVKCLEQGIDYIDEKSPLIHCFLSKEDILNTNLKINAIKLRQKAFDIQHKEQPPLITFKQHLNDHQDDQFQLGHN